MFMFRQFTSKVLNIFRFSLNLSLCHAFFQEITSIKRYLDQIVNEFRMHLENINVKTYSYLEVV